MYQDDFDHDQLRKDLQDYYGTAMFSGFPQAVFDLSNIERASDIDLQQIALNNGMDLTKYQR